MSFYTDEQLSMILSAHEAISWWGTFKYDNDLTAKELDNTWKWLTSVCSLFTDYATINGLLKRMEREGLA